MPLTKYNFKPGIDREGTDYSNEGGWFDINLVRFRKGFPEKIGGWVKEQITTYLGIGRALHAWIALEGTKYLGVGTTYKYYIKEGDTFNDITPIRATTSAGDVTFAKEANGDATLNVTDASHGAVQNDFVTYSGAATLGGLITATVLNQEYQIATVTSTNVYTIEAKDTDGDEVLANSSDSGNGGSSVVGAYQINVGLDDYVSGSGWGAGTWGAGGWGSVAALSDTSQLRLWTHDNFGEDLLINPRSGGLYYWTEDNGLSTRAVAFSDLTNANLVPTKAFQLIVSDIDRHILALGADPLNAAGTARTGNIDPLFLCWCDQENAPEWEPKYTNTAGSLRLSAGSQIIGGLRARQETLIWTMVAPKAAINAPPGVFWMDRSGFYLYGGAVARVPCAVHSYVFNDLNQGQAFKIFAFLNRQFNEVGWYYPSGSSTEIDRFVTYNYQEQVWAYGNLTRYAWLDEGVQPYPRATGTDTYNYIYQHETGNDADGSPMDNVYIETSDFTLDQSGNNFTFMHQAIPDILFTGDGGSDQVINFVLKMRNYPNKMRNYPNETFTTESTSTVTASTTKLNLRGRARQAVVRLESDDDADAGARLGVGWRLGSMRLNTRPDGRR